MIDALLCFAVGGVLIIALVIDLAALAGLLRHQLEEKQR